jgi:glycosyltransferase involved in cell wall biosynthesis
LASAGDGANDAVARVPLKICLVSPVPPPYGGIGHWTQLILRYAAGRPDVEIHVVNTAPRWRAVHDTALWKRLLGGGVQLLRDLARFVSLLVTRRPDAVHLTTSGHLASVRDLVVLGIAKLLDVPATYHLRFGRIPAIAAARTREWRMMRVAMRWATTVIAIDEATEEAIRHHAPEVSVVRVPNCVDPQDLAKPDGERRGEQTVLFLGWVIPAKGVGELLQAWDALQPDGWRLAIAGPCDESYLRQLRAREQHRNVDFAGELRHEEAMRALAAADVFVLPSHTEGFPNVVLEAMAQGKAIVATRVGAIPEMLDGGCGVLVRPGDVAELVSALRTVMSDASYRKALGGCARARALREYSIGAVFDRYVSIWANGASRSGPGVET